MLWFVYMVRCNDGTFYTGISPDVQKRVDLHNSGKGAKYTRGRIPVRLVFVELVGSKSLASKREYVVRHQTRLDKEKLACYTDCDYVAE